MIAIPAVITIAHRLSTAMEADHIILIEARRTVEAGSLDELLGTGGPLASFLELESAGWEWHGQGPAEL
jgi:ATP-binding cassette subfamily B protein